MTIESEVAALTAATTALLGSVNTAKATLDSSVSSAAASATTAGQHKDAAAASAASVANTAAGAAASVLAQVQSEVTQAASHKTSAAASASAAAASAASAASVLAQDLSEVAAQPLHRSPNAITGLFVYDTALDADGGEWVSAASLRSSLALEALNGVWRGACASEAACRAISGAATGDYFQHTTNGKFYKLNATSGTTEVQTGNSAAIPRVLGIVVEAASVTLYDLLAVGRPMWRRFPTGGTALTSGNIAGGSTAVLGHVTARDGVIAVSGDANSMGALLIDLIADEAVTWRQISGTSWGKYRYDGALADRAAGRGWSLVGTGTGVNSAALYQMALGAVPGAPVRPLSAVPVLHVAIGTSAGMVAQKADGTLAVASGVSWPVRQVAFDARGNIVFDIGENSYRYRIAAAPAYTSVSTYTATPETQATNAVWDSNRTVYSTQAGFSVACCTMTTNGLGGIAAPKIGLLVNNDTSTSANGVAAVATDTHASGTMFGTPSGAWLGCASVAGAVSSADLVTGDDSTFAGGAGTYTSSASYAATAAAVSGELQVTATVGFGRVMRSVTGLIVGRAYEVEAEARRISGTGAATVEWVGSTGGSVAAPISTVTSGTATKIRATSVATATTGYIALGEGTNVAGSVHGFDNIRVREVSLDASRRRIGLKVNGSTLTLTAVSSGAKLLAASAFSGTAYFSRSYDATADAYGTGAFTVSAWGSVPAGVTADSVLAERAGASGSRITLGVNASGQPYATVYDGTTTRTATASFAITNISKFEKLRLNYDGAGTVSLWLGGKQIASATGAALLTTDNAAAEWSVGNSYDATKPWPGSIALAKASAGVPTAEQAAWMYEQESALFAPGAQCTLPVATAITGVLSVDPTDGSYCVPQAATASKWKGLVRVATYTPSAGSFALMHGASGLLMASRTTTTPGVDVWTPAQALRSELFRLRRANRGERRVFDFDAVTAQTDFALPAGWRIVEVISAGAGKREGATKDWTRLWDGFIEAERFAVAPGNAVWVQIIAERV